MTAAIATPRPIRTAFDPDGRSQPRSAVAGAGLVEPATAGTAPGSTGWAMEVTAGSRQGWDGGTGAAQEFSPCTAETSRAGCEPDQWDRSLPPAGQVKR